MATEIKIEEKTILDLYNSGLSATSISKKLGCSSSTIYNKMDKYGIKRRSMSEAKTGITILRTVDINRDILYLLYVDERKTMSQIAKILGCGSTTVYKRLHEFNINTRSRGESNIKFDIPYKELREMYINKSMTSYEIAVLFGCSYKVVLRRLKTYGISIRSSEWYKLGTHMPDEIKERISLANSGSRNSRWRGGVSFGKYCPKFNEHIKEKVRDLYNNCDFLSGIHADTCNSGRKLDVHHIDYDKQQGCEDKKWCLIPLSKSNHARTNTKQFFWNQLFINALKYDSIGVENKSDVFKILPYEVNQ